MPGLFLSDSQMQGLWGNRGGRTVTLLSLDLLERQPRGAAGRTLEASYRLGDVHERKGKKYSIRVVGETAVECNMDGLWERFTTLKSLANAIQGSTVSMGGWRFFFGGRSPAEINALYGRKL